MFKRNQRNSARRVLAACATAIVVAAVGLTSAAPAQADTITYQERCSSSILGIRFPEDAFDVDLVVSPDKPTYNPGETVTVTWHWGTQPKYPGMPHIDSIPFYAEAAVNVGGSQHTAFGVRGQGRPAPENPSGSLELTDLTGTFTIPGSGPVTLTPGTYTVTAEGIGGTLIDCAPVVPPAVSRTLTVGADSGAGTVSQHITGVIGTGGLTISQQGDGIRLVGGAVSTRAQTMSGPLNPITVTDVRGGSLGWTLTADIGDFTSPDGGRIPADHFTWVPAVESAPGGLSVAVPGTPGRIAGGSVLASTPNAPRTGGAFIAKASISLAVPAMQQPGAYDTTLTLSLS
ncbi:hypothetical protein ACIBSV_35630 [Embleya sp. NPDC050154]|uniref:hypothetical protein n=1 Tax=unclassified Embleya TaxID=2699296 RepID=UPI0037A58AD3